MSTTITTTETEKYIGDSIPNPNYIHKENPLGSIVKSTERNIPKKKDIKKVKGAFIVKNVLTKDECKQFVELSEKLGYTEAPVSTYKGPVMLKDVRDNERVMYEASIEELDLIWENLKDFFPKYVYIDRKKWEICKQPLNERIRFYRYDTEQVFQPHYDGCFRRSETECSMFTLLVYLSDGFKGGQTTFFPDNKSKISVDPNVGQALAFWHRGPWSPLHEGTPHHSKGLYKYVLRSDVMYTIVKSELSDEEKKFDPLGN